jgi:hypothetical protein
VRPAHRQSQAPDLRLRLQRSSVPQLPGLGVIYDMDFIAANTTAHEVIH